MNKVVKSKTNICWGLIGAAKNSFIIIYWSFYLKLYIVSDMKQGPFFAFANMSSFLLSDSVWFRNKQIVVSMELKLDKLKIISWL